MAWRGGCGPLRGVVARRAGRGAPPGGRRILGGDAGARVRCSASPREPAARRAARGGKSDFRKRAARFLPAPPAARRLFAAAPERAFNHRAAVESSTPFQEAFPQGQAAFPLLTAQGQAAFRQAAFPLLVDAPSPLLAALLALESALTCAPLNGIRKGPGAAAGGADVRVAEGLSEPCSRFRQTRSGRLALVCSMGKAEQNFEAQREATLGSPHAEASRMLEAALQQMDGIISGGYHLSLQCK
ncbi:Protein of unknown function [Gryllus bimaculatus]|nr:Protein of unknown function [Gryllus bimaculatus]